MPSNTPPTATPDTAAVTEDGTLVATGNVLTNDTDPNGLALSVTAVNGVAVSGPTTIVGVYGTLVIQPSGAYTYTLSDSQADVRALSNGQVVPDAFAYTISDGQIYTTTTTEIEQNFILQSEAFDTPPWTTFAVSGALPAITANVGPGPSGGASTADEITLSSSGSGIYQTTSVSGTSTFSVWVKLISGSGAFSFDYYNGATGASSVQTATATSTWQQLSWTFTGSGNAASNLSLLTTAAQASGGTLEFWGAQLNSGSTPLAYVPTTTSAVNTTGTITSDVVVQSTLTVNLTGDVPTAAPDTGSVAEGGTLVATGNVLTNDTGPSAYPLSVTAVNGVAVSGPTTIVGVYGTLVIQPNGTYTYTLASTQANVVALTAGEVVPDAFAYTMSDGQIYTTTTTEPEQNFILQSEAFDTPPWTTFAVSGALPTITANVGPGPSGGASTADEITLLSSGSGIYQTTSVSGTSTFSVWVKLISGSGAFSFDYYNGATGASSVQTATATSTWQQLSWTFTGSGNAASNLSLLTTAAQASGGTLEFWGAQLNSGSTPLAYVPTTTSAVNTTGTITSDVSLGSTLTVSVTGDGSPPTATPDTAAVTEDGTLVATGNVLTNDTDPNGLALSVTAVNGVAVSGPTTIMGVYGTLVIQPSGAYTYTLSDSQADVRALSNGQVVPDAFAYTISDGQIYTTTTTEIEQNFILQSEAFDTPPWTTFAVSGALPAITANVGPGPSGGASTADEITLSSSGSGIYQTTSVSGTSTFSVWVKLISGSGAFSFDYYNGATGASSVQTATATSTWQQLSWTFTGSGNAASNLSLLTTAAQASGGTLEFWGAQLNSGSTPLAYVPTTTSAVNTTGTITSDVVVQSTLTVNLTGDVPTAAPDTGSVAEGGTLVATGNVLTNDTGPSAYPLSVTAVNGVAVSGPTTIVGVYGTLVIQPNGTYTYTLASTQANVVALTAGEVVPDAFAYTISDGQIYTTTTTEIEQNFILQSEAFDTPPWTTFAVSGALPTITANVGPGPSGGASTADEITLLSSGSGIYQTTSVSGTSTFSVWVKLISGSGAFSFDYYNGATGASSVQTATATSTWQQLSWTFTGSGNAASNLSLLTTAAQASGGTLEFWGAQLNSGSTPLAYVPTTTSAVNTTGTITSDVSLGSTLTVSVTGDGSPPTATPDTAAVTEDGTLVATGNVLTNDTDPNGLALSVTAVNGVAVSGPTTIMGVYGTLVIQPSGAYTYTLSDSQADVRALSNGQVVPDAFAYTISDGVPYTTTTTQIEQNFILQSEAFDTWTQVSPTGLPPLVVTANVGSGPLGGASTADQLNLSGPGSAISTLVSVLGQYTFSVWVRLVSGSGAFALDYCSGSTKTNVSQTDVATSAWQQFSFTFAGDGNAASYVAIEHAFNQSAEGVFELWGAQVNAGTTPTTYVATTGTAINTTTTVTTSPGSTLTVDVTGETPTANPDSAAVAVGGTQQATGNLLANDSTPSGTTLSIATVDGIAVTGATTISATYGTLVLQPNGQYTYTLNATAPMVQALAGGEVQQDVFSYTVSDGLVYDAPGTQADQNLLAQSNVSVAPWTTYADSGIVPVITANYGVGPSGGASDATEVQIKNENSGIYYLTNVPGEYTFSVWVRLISGSGAFAFSYYSSYLDTSFAQVATATGTWERFSWTFDGDGEDGSNIVLGQTATQTGSDTLELWGAQLNPGTTADTYVPTTGSPVTTTVPASGSATIGSNLVVSVTGSNTGKTGTTLNLQSSTQGDVVDLATDQYTTPLTVMPLGDSITYGWSAQDMVTQNTLSGGYRAPLFQDFESAGMLVNYVGDQNAGPSTLPDTENAGYPGERTDQILARLPGLLATYNPNIILLMAGTNDVKQGVAVSTIIANLTSMLDMISAANPSTHVYLSQLLPLASDVQNYGEVPSVNTAIATLVQQADAAGQNVTLVSMSNITTADLFDGVHPDPAGYALMAQNWYNAILAAQPNVAGTPGGTVNTISPSVTNVIGGSGNNLLIGNANNDILTAGPGNDILVAGGGNTTLVGGAGADQFDIKPIAGNITILDFSASQGDLLLWDNIPGLTSSANLTPVTVQSGGQTVINLASFGTNLTVTLAGYTGSVSNQSVFLT